MAQGRYETDERAREAPHDLSALGFDPGKAIAVVTTTAKENPHAALAGAVAVGFLLGGGLTPRFLGAIAMFAARRYFKVAVEETLASVQESLEGRSPHEA